MSLIAPYTVEFPFERTVGPKIGTFLGGLRDGRLYGVRTERGVLCPPLEFDPATGAETGELVPLDPVGSVTTWTWVRGGAEDPPSSAGGPPLSHDFAWALITIDGTTGGLFHAVDVGGDPDRLHAGLRVRARWRPERVGHIRDIECFEEVP